VQAVWPRLAGWLAGWGGAEAPQKGMWDNLLGLMQIDAHAGQSGADTNVTTISLFLLLSRRACPWVTYLVCCLHSSPSNLAKEIEHD